MTRITTNWLWVNLTLQKIWSISEFVYPASSFLRISFKIFTGCVMIVIFSVGRDYVRLMKYGDSLYRCKQLKKAALGRMAKIIKNQASSLEYLEQGWCW